MSATAAAAAAQRLAETVRGGVLGSGSGGSDTVAAPDLAPWGPTLTGGAAGTPPPPPVSEPEPVPYKSKAPPPLRNPWGQDGLRQRYARLEEDITAEVVVVGAGLSGLSTAYRLARAGKSVVVLESRLVGSGSAGRGMGLMSTWVKDTYREVERVAGLERARQVAEAHAAAVAFVRQVVAEERIDCELAEVEGAVQIDDPRQREGPAGDSRASRALREELAACCRAGVEGARIEFRQPGVHQPRTEIQIQSQAGAGAGAGSEEGALEETLVLSGCINVHPVKYLTGLAEAVLRHGGRIFEGTRAKGGLVTGPSGGVVKTMHGPVARASEAVVLATHSPINRNQLWVHDRQIPKRDYSVALEVPVGSVPAHFSQLTTLGLGPGGWGSWLGLGDGTAALASPGGRHSVRVAALPAAHLIPGEAGGGAATSYEANKELLVVVGELHHQGQDEKQYVGDPWDRLEHWARDRFPQCGRTLYRWSGSDYYPADMLGLYGRDPLDLSVPPVYILTGHGGQEWTGATLGSQVVSGAVLGGSEDPTWRDVYRPSRVLPGAAAKYTSELALYFSTVGVALLKHVVPRGLTDVVGLVTPGSVERSIKAGEGRVAQHGLLKKALYRDARGVLHLHSALCTHLGCCVEWNPRDKTFDCPCHGSQYDTCGTCIHGPAVADLEDLGCREP